MKKIIFFALLLSLCLSTSVVAAELNQSSTVNASLFLKIRVTGPMDLRLIMQVLCI